MLWQLIPVAILSAVTSPTAIAAVLLILSRPRARSLLMAYVLGSMITSVLIGIGLVALLTATGASHPHGTTTPTVDIIVGVLMLLSAGWLGSGRSADLRRRAAALLVDRRARRKARSDGRPSRTKRILTAGSVRFVVALGVATHLPGLLYLVALSDIASAKLSKPVVLVVIIGFNVVMLLPIELPLLGCIVDPRRTHHAVENADAFIHSHQRRGMLIAAVVTGGYLMTTGIIALAR